MTLSFRVRLGGSNDNYHHIPAKDRKLVKVFALDWFPVMG